MKEKAANKSILALPIVAILVALAALLTGCSSAPSLADTFKYQSPFTIGDVEYTIESIEPAESDYPDTGTHNGVMYLTVSCKLLENGAEPELMDRLTMYDSAGLENDAVIGNNDGEHTVGAMKGDVEATYRIGYGYDYDQPSYELQVSETYGGEAVASFKFSIDPETLEVTILED